MSATQARKRVLRTVCLAAVALPLAAATAWSAEVTAQTGFGFDGWWSRTGRGRATQVQVPLSVDVQAGDFSAGLLAAYLYTQRPDRPDVVLAGPTDTKLTTSYELSGTLPVDVLFGLDFSLPTGRKNLTRDEIKLQWDEDLLPVTNFGEGLDVNPTLTLARAWGPVAAGLSAGYLWRGSYTRSADLGVDDYNPSEVATVSGELRWAFLPSWETRLGGRYARHGYDKVNGDAFLREGDFYALVVGVRRSGEAWSTSLDLQGVVRKCDKVAKWNGALDTEPEKSRGRQWRATAATEGKLGASTRLLASLDGLYVAKNDYRENSPYYVPKKRKVSATVGLAQRLARSWEARFDLGGFYMDVGETRYYDYQEREYPKYQYEEPSRYLGASVRASLTASF